MNAILFLLPIAIGLGGTFAYAFLWAVRNGQYEDLDDPPERVLRDP